MPDTPDGQRYRLIEVIGRGAVSEVWRGESLVGDVVVAIKCLVPRWADQRAARVSLEREWTVLSTLAHRSIVGAYGWLESADIVALPEQPNHVFGIALEYLAGGDLVSLAGAAPAHWLGAIQDVIQALAYLHERGIVHGDIKSRNVLFNRHDEARLIDFSCAAAVGELVRQPFGTLTQQRPRLDGHIVTVDDDIFACAALLHELIAGRPPRLHDRPDEMRAVLHGRGKLAPRPLDRLIDWIIEVLLSDSMQDVASLSECGALLEDMQADFSRSN